MENKDNPFIDYYRGMFQKIIHNDDYSTKSAFPIVKNTVTNLLWPCALYRVEVQSSKMLLDVFERTVLGLAECKITTTAEVSSNMKMTPEIIEFIQNRLVSKRLLEPITFEITEKGSGCLQKVLSEQNSEPIVVCILKDLISGKLLDYAEVNPPLNSIKGIFSGKENTPYVKYFLPGNAELKADLVFPESLDIIERNKFTKPEPALILRAIRRFNKFADNEDKIPLNNSSNKAEIKTEEYVLVATSAFATTAGDIYSTDVTGTGISDIYTDFIREANSETNPWLKKIFDNGTVTQDAENEESISDDPRFTYPSVSKPLFETYKKIESIKNVNIKEGVTERQEIQRKGEQIIYDLYSAFEDVMKLHYQNNHDTNEEDSRIRVADEEARMLNKQMLSETEAIDSSTILYYPLAETLGFELTEQEKQSLKVYRGKIKEMRDGGQSEFAPLLCLMLAYANSQDETPLDYLCEKHPDFISQLLSLKELRDKTHMAHGPGVAANEIKYEIVSKYMNLVFSYSTILCPELKDDIKSISGFRIQDVEYERFSANYNQRFNAKLKLYKTFGNSTINSLNSNIVNQMINCSMSLKDKKYVVGSICSVMQQIFEESIVSILRRENPPVKEQRNTKYASEKCKSAGFYLTSGVLPESLNTVNYRRVNKAVCGACDTLGAAVIGFILLADDRELKDISSRHPEMIIDIDKLLKQRGHKDVREYSSEEVSTFENIYTYIIKEILNFIE